MKYKLERKVKVVVEDIKTDIVLNYPFKHFKLRGMEDGQEYCFTCGMLLPPWNNPVWNTADIYWGNYVYEEPGDNGCNHYKHAELVIPDKNQERGWLRINTLEPEPEDFVQQHDWEQLATLFPLSQK